jgi:hypothetical protein
MTRELNFSELCGFFDKQWQATEIADAHRYTLYGGTRGPGKALALDTRIPTPDGWTTMGQLRLGDPVIGRDGKACRVTWISETFVSRPCYKLTFDDDSTIVADGQHEWLVFSRDDRRALVKRTDEWRARRRAKRERRGTGAKPWLSLRNALNPPAALTAPTGQIKTTQAIAETLVVGRHKETNWSVPTCAAYDCADVELPLDPYVLGVWLGDGTATMGAITSADAEIIESVRSAGFVVKKWSGLYQWGVAGLKPIIRQMGLFNNKHIPPYYLRGSRSQRLAILQGLLDTDGSVGRDGRAEFTSVNSALAHGVHELVLSLGYKATLRTGRASLNGRDCGPKWRIEWTADDSLFRLSRKRSKQRLDGHNGSHRWRYIVKCEPVASVPTRCIEVDSADHLYLAGNWIPTHNSYWLRWYALRRLLKWGAQGARQARVGLFCEDYPSLVERQISKISTEFPRWLGEIKETRTDGLCFFLKPRYGGGKIALRNLDDASKYQSAEFAGIAIDELTKNRETVFDTLRGSLRWPGVADTFWVSASNPNGIGQKWVREYFIEKNLPPNLKGKENDFAFLPGSPRDNPHLDVSYWEMLDTLPDKLRQAWRDGNWYVTFEGVVFSEFGAENITDAEPDPNLPFELAVDDGYIDPRAILFVQRTGTQILVFDELYHTRHLGETCVREVLNKCIERAGLTLPDELQSAENEKIAVWCREGTDKPRVQLPEIAIGSPEAKELEQHFRLADIPYRYQPHEVVEGIKVVRRLICDGQGIRTLKVNRRCRNLIWELTEGYQYPPGAKADSEKPADGNDHAADALRYWCWMRARK